MANIKSAKKRILVAETRAARNKAIRSKVKTSETKKAVLAGNDAMRQFRSRLKEAGAKVLEEVEKEGRYAVVLASSEPLRRRKYICPGCQNKEDCLRSGQTSDKRIVPET